MFGCFYTDSSGVCVRCGLRQSMPSSNIDNCARVNETVPLCACGQMKRPRSNRFRKQTQAVTVLPQELDQIAPPTAEDEDMSGERILFQNRLYRGAQSSKTPSKIRHTRGDPDVCTRGCLATSIPISTGAPAAGNGFAIVCTVSSP
jgi:hypothetical protein